MKTEKQSKTRLTAGGLLMASTLALGGCFFGAADEPGSGTTSSTGGGSSAGGGSTTGGGVPDSAKSPSGFAAFLKGLVSDETSEPIALGTFTPDTTDNEEAQSL